MKLNPLPVWLCTAEQELRPPLCSDTNPPGGHCPLRPLLRSNLFFLTRLNEVNPVNPFLKQKSVSIGEICGSETPPQSNLVNPVNPVQKPESVKICEI
ncbi:MAG: hypothetical protein AAGK14_15125, partial [Verrucomicrobiota bacterium]